MRPNRIILVRHGESEGNLDKYKYRTTPDYALNLTQRGLSSLIRLAWRYRESSAPKVRTRICRRTTERDKHFNI